MLLQSYEVIILLVISLYSTNFWGLYFFLSINVFILLKIANGDSNLLVGFILFKTFVFVTRIILSLLKVDVQSLFDLKTN